MIVAPAPEGPEAARRAATTSASGAPQVAQNLIPGATGEAQRGQFGPELGAVSRRPHWGQNGCCPLARLPQNGQEIGSPWATVGRATTRVSGNDAAPPVPPPADAAGALRLADWLMGLPQSIQNSAPGSFPRPQ